MAPDLDDYYRHRAETSNRQDWQENRVFVDHQRRLRHIDELREAGYWEACFSKDNKTHMTQYSRVVTELTVRGWLGDYVVEEMEGVQFLFLSERAKELFSEEPDFIPFRQLNSGKL